MPVDLMKGSIDQNLYTYKIETRITLKTKDAYLLKLLRPEIQELLGSKINIQQ